MVQITFIEFSGKSHPVEAKTGQSVMETAKSNGVPGIDADCGGSCACATCHVHIPAEWQKITGTASENEKELLEFAAEADADSRLSCQIKVTEEMNGLTVKLPSTQR